MSLELTFKNGRISGRGDDEVGPFSIQGDYDIETRTCGWRKAYRSHTVHYSGTQHGENIVGSWSIPRMPASWCGGFRIWRGEKGALSEEFFLVERETTELEKLEPALALLRFL